MALTNTNDFETGFGFGLINQGLRFTCPEFYKPGIDLFRNILCLIWVRVFISAIDSPIKI